MYSSPHVIPHALCFFFFFNDTATTEIYTLSLHDALPICSRMAARNFPGRYSILLIVPAAGERLTCTFQTARKILDRKSTRLNSSHLVISYAVFCLKKKKKSTRSRRPVVDESAPVIEPRSC